MNQSDKGEVVTANYVRIDAEFSIQDGKLDEFKRVTNDIIDKVEANEPNMLSYEWYLSGDGSTCRVVDTYRDSDAIMAHFGNVGELLGALGEIAPITQFKIYGPLSDEVRQATEPFSPKCYDHFGGFTR